MKVQCPSCKKVCHQTNARFNPDIRPSGFMVDLLSPWTTYGWDKFGESGGAAVDCSSMLCTVCSAPLAPRGRLHLVPDDYREVPKPPTLEEINQQVIRETWMILEDLFDSSLPKEGADAESTEARVPRGGPMPPLTQDDKPWMCLVCEWTGKTEPALKRHMTMVHN